MRRSLKSIYPTFTPGALHKGIAVSAVLHVALILVFFTSPLVKNIASSQVLFVSLSPIEDALPAAKPAAAAPAVEKKSQPSQSVVKPVKLVQAAPVVPAKPESREDALPIEKDEVLSEEPLPLLEEPQPAMPARSNLSHAPVADGAQSAMSAASSSGNGLAKDGSGEGADYGIAEARFGDRGAPKFVYQEMPIYPALARRLGKEGRVLLKLLIDADGKLLNVEVVEAAGYGFTEASVAAVKKSIYAPGIRGGVKVATRALLPVSFRLQ